MLAPWFVSVVALGYLGLLFAIAFYGDRRAEQGRGGARESVIYALSLAIYCTSWTFYGSVGRAASHGIDFILIYVGPILLILPGYPIMRKILRIARVNNVTSIADFIGARYGKSRPVAALATVIAVVGVLPYLALQLQAVTLSFNALVSASLDVVLVDPGLPAWRDTALYVALMMAMFSILFGVRHVHASERHHGLILAIAFESLVKLGAFLAVGLFVVFGLFEGPMQLFHQAMLEPEVAARVEAIAFQPAWISITLLAAFAFICLPRQFHVAVVESGRPANLRMAAWLFPLYLVAINLFVPAIALVGLLRFPEGTPPDLFVLMLPVAEQQSWLSLAVFIGGLSASTSMVIVEGVALSTMICNELVMPVLLRRQSLRTASGGAMGGLLLAIRRSAIFAVLLAAYGYHTLIGDRYPLASIGLISFCAVAQFGPALLLGLYWRDAHRLGALAGMAGGALVWAYALLLPSLSEAGWLPAALGGGVLPSVLAGIDPLTNGAIWSLLVNVTLFVGGSLLAHQHEHDRQQAQVFVAGEMSVDAGGAESAGHAPAFDDLKSLVARFLGDERAERAFAGPVGAYRERELAAFTERLLSGAIGAASARIVVAAVLRRRWASTWASRAMLDEASQAILQNRDLLRATLENVSQGIGMFDPELRLAAWNRRFLGLLGIPEELAQIGTPLALIAESPERRRSAVGVDLAILQEVPRDPALAAMPHTYERRRGDGRVLELQTNPMPSGGFVLVCTDITERTQSLEALLDSERRIREANEMLERRVGERTQELTQLNEELSEAKATAEAANVGKTRFLAAASHDLLQPLHAARLFAGALAERPRGAKSGTLVHQLDQALGAVDELLQALLDISKLDAGALKPQPRPIVVGDVLDSVAASFEPMAEQRGLSLRVVPSRLVVLTDPALLRRVLQNFVSNAIRYTRRGGVLIGCRRRGGRVAIEVWDTGPGIPESKLGVIFEEFKRLGSQEGDAPAGLGLGLAIVDRIARMLDHPVAVRSWPGRGSVFSVSLPLGAAVPLVSRPTPDRRAPNVLAGRVVLCIDNDASVLAAMRPLLEGWSCTVLTVADLAGARRELKRCAQAPDIILADHHLEGGETGMAAIRTLAEELGARVPAILITADYSEALSEAAQASGYPILHKPLRPAALRALMSQVLLRETRWLAALG